MSRVFNIQEIGGFFAGLFAVGFFAFRLGSAFLGILAYFGLAAFTFFGLSFMELFSGICSIPLGFLVSWTWKPLVFRLLEFLCFSQPESHLEVDVHLDIVITNLDVFHGVLKNGVA